MYSFEQPRSFDRGPQRSFDRAPQRSGPVPMGPERQAKVKWFNADKGFGFVELTDGTGEAFLHISVVEAAGYSALEPGTTLTTRVGQGQKGPQITEVVAVDTSTAEPAPPRGNRDRPMDRAPRDRGFDRGGDRGFDRGPTQEAVGEVKWYNPEKGFGFIAVEGSKDVFIHRSVLARAGLSTLAENQRVRLQIGSGMKGLEATAIELAD